MIKQYRCQKGSEVVNNQNLFDDRLLSRKVSLGVWAVGNYQSVAIVHRPAAASGAPAAEFGTAWPGTVWSQSAGDRPSFCWWCGWRHLGHSCGSRGSSLRSTRCSWRRCQTPGRISRRRSPDAAALLERHARRGKYLPCTWSWKMFDVHSFDGSSWVRKFSTNTVWHAVNCCSGEVRVCLRITLTDVSHICKPSDISLVLNCLFGHKPLGPESTVGCSMFETPAILRLTAALKGTGYHNNNKKNICSYAIYAKVHMWGLSTADKIKT